MGGIGCVVGVVGFCLLFKFMVKLYVVLCIFFLCMGCWGLELCWWCD